MIQITLNTEDPIVRLIEARSQYSGREVEQVAQELVHESFIQLIHTLHEQFMSGEISQGKMAELLGINRIDLIHLLEDLSLQVTNL